MSRSDPASRLSAAIRYPSRFHGSAFRLLLSAIFFAQAQDFSVESLFGVLTFGVPLLPRLPGPSTLTFSRFCGTKRVGRFATSTPTTPMQRSCGGSPILRTSKIRSIHLKLRRIFIARSMCFLLVA